MPARRGVAWRRTPLGTAVVAGSLCALIATYVVPAHAQPPAADTPAAADADAPADAAPESFFEILNAGGIVGFLIILLSLAALARIIDHLLTIRESVLVPRQLADRVRQLLDKGQVEQAAQQCQRTPCLLSHVLAAGISESSTGWPEVQKAVEDALAEQSARLLRKIEWLSVIGNIAPMLGLLGTVIGMVLAFREVAFTQGAARAADLAEGIYLALVTTVQGLVVAIPSLGAFAVFRNRVDYLLAEATSMAQHALAPLKGVRQHKVVQPPPVSREGLA